MKKLKVLMMGGMLAAGICLFAACGTANDDGTNNGVNDTSNTQVTTQENIPGTDNTTGNGTTDNNTDAGNSKNDGNVGKDIGDVGKDVVDGVKDAGDAVADGVDDAIDAVDPDADRYAVHVSENKSRLSGTSSSLERKLSLSWFPLRYKKSIWGCVQIMSLTVLRANADTFRVSNRSPDIMIRRTPVFSAYSTIRVNVRMISLLRSLACSFVRFAVIWESRCRSAQ